MVVYQRKLIEGGVVAKFVIARKRILRNSLDECFYKKEMIILDISINYSN